MLEGGEPADCEAGGSSGLERALGVLGPLEARIMQVVWTGALAATFTVHDVHDRM